MNHLSIRYEKFIAIINLQSKQENKKFCCPSCRNEFPKENWNKKVDFEGNRKDNANLINKMNHNRIFV